MLSASKASPIRNSNTAPGMMTFIRPHAVHCRLENSSYEGLDNFVINQTLYRLYQRIYVKFIELNKHSGASITNDNNIVISSKINNSSTAPI